MSKASLAPYRAKRDFTKTKEPSGKADVLWREGAMVWSGAVGAYVRDVAFDTVSRHIDDSAMMPTRVSRQANAEAGQLPGLQRIEGVLACRYQPLGWGSRAASEKADGEQVNVRRAFQRHDPPLDPG